MFKKLRGLVLIELLIVVAIIGIIVALIIPKALMEIQKNKQRATMQNMEIISATIADYLNNEGTVPKQDGNYDVNSSFYKALCSDYRETLPIIDEWGNPFWVFCGAAINGIYRISADKNDFLVVSLGRDKMEENFIFNKDNPKAGIFKLKKSSDFKNDLIMFNNCWIRGLERVASKK